MWALPDSPEELRQVSHVEHFFADALVEPSVASQTLSADSDNGAVCVGRRRYQTNLQFKVEFDRFPVSRLDLSSDRIPATTDFTLHNNSRQKLTSNKEIVYKLLTHITLKKLLLLFNFLVTLLQFNNFLIVMFLGYRGCYCIVGLK